MNQPHPWVILFDIDGTILTVDRNFNRPLLRSILDDLEIHYPDMEKDPFSGRTDHDILTSFLVNHDYSEELYKKMKDVYLQRIDDEIQSHHVVRHPHIEESISYFEELGSHIGLLTGNFPSAAKAKLRAASIDYDFSFGAFGEHHRDRNQLPLLAMETVKELYGFEPDPSRFLIIGDTPRDIQCANYAGMKSVAVTTGKFSHDELKKHEPDLILENLAQPENWFLKLS